MKGVASGRRAGGFGFAPHHLIHGEALPQNWPQLLCQVFQVDDRKSSRDKQGLVTVKGLSRLDRHALPQQIGVGRREWNMTNQVGEGEATARTKNSMRLTKD